MENVDFDYHYIHVAVSADANLLLITPPNTIVFEAALFCKGLR
jgi:hypothetical protein